MLNLKTLAVIEIAFLIGLGCSKSETVVNGESKGANSSFAALRDEDVLVRVGKNEFTKASFKRLCALRTRMLELANAGKMQRELNKNAIELQTLVAYPSKVTVETCISDYAATNGISVAKEHIDAARKLFQKASNKPFLSWKSFLKNFSGVALEELESEVAKMAMQNAVRQWYFMKNPVVVTDEEAADCQKWIADYNARAAQTNSVIWANASNIWQQIVKKQIAFEDAANKYTQDECEPVNGEWAAFTLDAFADEPRLARTIKNMVPGEITPPIEGDNGLMILKLVGIDEPKDGGASRYMLSRVFFRLPEFYETVSTAELKKEMFKTKEGKTFVKFVDGLTKIVGMEIVCDKNIFKEAQQAMKLPGAVML